MTRSRRAGLSRDQARQQPLYARMLGLQYLAPSGLLCFVFLEGAIALGILLALAELVSWWGVLALPLTVAVMVKLNDVVAGAMIHPATGVRPAPAGSVRAAGSPGAKTVRVSAAAIARVQAEEAPKLRPRKLLFRKGDPRPESGEQLPQASQPGRGSPPQQPGGASSQAGGPLSEQGRGSPSQQPEGPLPQQAGGSLPQQAGMPSPQQAEGPPLRPAAVRPHAVGTGKRDGDRWTPPSMSGIDASPLNGPPMARQWTDQLDDSEARARQSATRHYE